MGWTSYYADEFDKHGKLDRKKMVEKVYTYDFVNGKGKSEVLKSCLVGRVVYLAVKLTDYENPQRNCVYAGVCLTGVHGNEFSYKDMCESEGPVYYDCPSSILNLLTDTQEQYAIEWRKKCREEIEKKKMAKKDANSLSNLPYGAFITVDMPTQNGPMKLLLEKKQGYKPKTIWIVRNICKYTGYRLSENKIKNYGYVVQK